MFIIAILLLIKLSTAVKNESRCCEDDQLIIKPSPDTPLLCWNEKKNTTQPLNLKCELNVLVTEKYLNMSINNKGELLLDFGDLGSQTTLEPEIFCMDIYLKKSILTKKKTRIRSVVICSETQSFFNPTLQACCCIISSIFFVCTAVVYATLHEIRDLQGKSLVNICICMAIALAKLAYLNIGELSLGVMCTATGFLLYFFLVAAFFWMNAVSIQTLISIRRPPQSDFGWKEFIQYAIYCYGMTLTLTIITIITNYVPGKHRKPGIGLNTCWFNSKVEQWWYFYSVLSILIAANICIFAYTSVNIWRNTFTSTHLKALKYKCTLMLRLFILMGLPWIFEMISSLVKSNIIIEIVDMLNVLQGPVYFLLLVIFRKRVAKAMYRRGWLKCIAGSVEKYLAVGEDVEEHIIQDPVVKMNHEGIDIQTKS